MAFEVDTLHMGYESVYRTRKMLEDFIEHKIEPGDLILILPTGGGSGLYQQFTSDQRILRRAVTKLRPFVTNFNGIAGRTITSPLDRRGGFSREGSTLSQRRFRRDGQFSYSYVIYNAKSERGETQLEARVRILRGLKVMFDGKRRPVQMLDGSNPPSRIISGGVIRLGDLAPDDYTLEVTVIDILRKKDSQRVVRQEIDFSVE